MIKIPPPPAKPDALPLGTPLRAGLGISTVVADMDFETYSPSGFLWNSKTNSFEALPGAPGKGLPAVGAAKYSEHLDAEVLSLAYNLKDGRGPQLWTNGQPLPYDLFRYIAEGGIIEAWNCTFEKWVWDNICVRKYRWRLLPARQLRDAAAKARAFSLPGKLEKAGEILNTAAKKDKDGMRLLNKFSIPRNPTLKDKHRRIELKDDEEDAKKLFLYNLKDIETEAEISSLCPDLSPQELEYWFCDQDINRRGVQIDIHNVEAAIKIVEQAMVKYNRELYELTNGVVNAASEIEKLKNWINGSLSCMKISDLQAETIIDQLKRNDLPQPIRRALEIRQLVGSAAVKKLYAMKNQMTKDGRLHDLFIYHSARTGRAAGTGPQPQNLPNHGPIINECNICKKYFNVNEEGCPWCGYNPQHDLGAATAREWNHHAVENALETIATGSLEVAEYYWDDALEIVSACLRGMFIAAPGKDLICSDYKSIEAVVLAMLAGEDWRIEIFKTHGKIYETSASKITGIPFEEFEHHLVKHKTHHSMRKLGKVAELASGYGGWIGAWKRFGADNFLSDEEIKRHILAWRKASPKVVEFWGGQERNWEPELFGLEGAVIRAIQNPGVIFTVGLIFYQIRGDVLYGQLPSGRYLVYHRPRLTPAIAPRRGLAISFEGWNTNPQAGAIGWVRMYTYGGKLCENNVQAVARDLFMHGILNLELAGYPVVLHTHDEPVAEIPEGWGSIQEFEQLLSTTPSWATGWPVKTGGGWRGKRYRK